jgi:hypothetical protein
MRRLPPISAWGLKLMEVNGAMGVSFSRLMSFRVHARTQY